MFCSVLLFSPDPFSVFPFFLFHFSSPFSSLSFLLGVRPSFCGPFVSFHVCPLPLLFLFLFSLLFFPRLCLSFLLCHWPLAWVQHIKYN